MSVLFYFFKKMRPHVLILLLAFFLGCMTLGAGIALLALAGFLITGAALAGLIPATAFQFNYLLPAAFIRLFALIRIGGRYGERLTSHDGTFRILSDIRLWFFETLRPRAVSYLLKQKSGDILHHALTDVQTLENLYLRTISPFLQCILIAIASSMFLYFFDKSLFFIFTGLFLMAIFVIPYFIYLATKKTGKKLQKAIEKLRTQFIDFKQFALDFKLFDHTPIAKKEMKEIEATLFSCQKKLFLIRGAAFFFLQCVMGIAMLSIFYVLTPLVKTHQISGPFYVLIIFMTLAVFEAMSALPQATSFLSATYASAKRLFAMHASPIPISFPDPEKSTLVSVPQYDLYFRNCSFGYENQSPLFNDFSFSFKQGDKWCISGPSGIGKTTLFHLLQRFIEPSKGNIYLGENALSTLNEDFLRHTFGVLPQRVHLFNQSIRDNLFLAQKKITDDEIKIILDKVELKHLVEKLPEGLDTRMGEFGERFSGGEIRRFGIARALLWDAPILLLDEPTEGLNHALAEKIIARLLADYPEKTILVVTHQPALFEKSSGWQHLDIQALT